MFSRDNAPRQYPPYVSHSPSPTGTKALYTYLEESDIETKQWKSDPSSLTKERNTLLLMIEPSSSLSMEETAYYERFMEKGNTIVFFSERPKGFFNLTMEDVEQFSEDVAFSYNGQRYELYMSDFERFVLSDGDKSLLTNSAGTFGLERQFGEGRLIAIKGSNFLVNEYVTEAEHAEFITTLIEDIYEEGQVIIFDEFVHDSSRLSSFVNAFPIPIVVIFLQGIIIAILWLLYKGKRFGPIYEPRIDTVRFSDEGIVALASWYMREEKFEESLKVQADYVKQRLYDKWNIPYHWSWEDSKGLLKQKWDLPNKDIEQFVDDLQQVLRKPHINKDEYVTWSKRLDDLRKEVEDK